MRSNILKLILANLIICQGSCAQVLIAGFNPPAPTDHTVALISPHIAGVVLRVDWSEIEMQPGVYTFSALDAKIAAWRKIGLKVDLILELVSDSVLHGQKNSATPKWELPKDISRCDIPAVWEEPFASGARKFVGATLSHYSKDQTIMVRSGPVIGGEARMVCLPYQDFWNEKAFIGYVDAFDSFLSGNSHGHRVAISANDSLARELAEIGHDYGLTLGNSSLEKYHFPFEKSLFSGYREPTYFQTGSASDPSGHGPTGSLVQLMPFARSLRAKIVEVYWQDLQIAYDPNNPDYQKYGAGYRKALQ